MAENEFAYDEAPAAFVYHPECKWDLDSEKFKKTAAAYLGGEPTEEEFAKFRDEV